MLDGESRSVKKVDSYIRIVQIILNGKFFDIINLKSFRVYSIIMKASRIGRYSKYIRLISAAMDLLIISIMVDLFLEYVVSDAFNFFIYIVTGWTIVSFFNQFYNVYRFTTVIEIISKIIKQGVLFLLVVIAFFPFAKETVFSGNSIAVFIISIIFLISISKFFLFFC
jgi:putative colanic acid biosynthesis UDP-glucose lipid carrier transferase